MRTKFPDFNKGGLVGGEGLWAVGVRLRGVVPRFETAGTLQLVVGVSETR